MAIFLLTIIIINAFMGDTLSKYVNVAAMASLKNEQLDS